MKPIVSRIAIESAHCKLFRSQFGLPTGKVRNVKRNASVFDTIHWMQRKKIPSELNQTKKYAKAIAKQNKGLAQVTVRIWNDLFGCTRYQFDELGKEQVRSPNRLVHDRAGDCDCFTAFISSVLLNLGIDHLLRMTAYEEGWQHIYIIVPKRKGQLITKGNPEKEVLTRSDYLVLDPVIEVYNKEKPYSKKYDVLMSRTTLQSLSGISALQAPALASCSCHQDFRNAEDLGFLKKLFDKIGETKVGKAFRDTRDVVKKTVGNGIKFVNRYANPATILLRNGILLGMKINMFQLAKKLRWAYLGEAELRRRGWQQSDIDQLIKGVEKLQNIHKGAGGKTANLRETILNGKGNQDGKIPKTARGLGNFDDSDYDDPLSYLIFKTSVEELEKEILLTDNGLGEVSTGAALAAASSVLAAIAKLISTIAPPKEEDSSSWNTDSQFPPAQLNDPFLDQILNNPQGFDVEQAIASSENYAQENINTQKRNIVEDNDKKSNKGLIIGALALFGFGLYAMSGNNEPPKGGAAALAGVKKKRRKTKRSTTKRKRSTKGKRKSRAKPHQQLAHITL